MQTFGRYTDNIVAISVEQMRMVDNLMENKYGINLYLMMENAGRSLAILATKYFYDGTAKNKKIAVLAGPGGNGGGALVAARRLKNWGADVHVFLSTTEDELKPVTRTQLEIDKKIGITIFQAEHLKNIARYDIILDGIYGYSLKGAPGQMAAHMIEWAHHQQSKILSLDIRYAIETLDLKKNARYGFEASFNPTFPEKKRHPLGWISEWQFAINQGPVILMIENYNTGLIWNLMKKSPYIINGLRRAGFTGGCLNEA